MIKTTLLLPTLSRMRLKTAFQVSSLNKLTFDKNISTAAATPMAPVVSQMPTLH
jgi:hypothetical protein